MSAVVTKSEKKARGGTLLLRVRHIHTMLPVAMPVRPVVELPNGGPVTLNLRRKVLSIMRRILR